MKCPNCGAEIGPTSQFCASCGSQISYEMKREQEQLNKQGCPHCGSSNISFNREKQAEFRAKNGTNVIRRTVGLCKDCGYTWSTNMDVPEKKSKLWLWVLGWICIFPVPLTILLLRNKDMKPALKYAIIAVAWIVFLIIGLSGKSKDTKQQAANEKSQTEVETVSEEKETANADAEEVMDVVLKVEPNINVDDGTVLFGITTNLPENTELMITVSNADGYKAQDKVVILAKGSGFTSEFSDHGKALKGDYDVSVSMSLPALQKDSVRKVIGEEGERIGGQYVKKSEIGHSNYVSGEFHFSF